MNWSEYKTQGVPAVDLCAAAIMMHRKKNIPLKALHLKKFLYDQFKLWTEKNLKRELAEGEQIQFDDVHIEDGGAKQVTPVLPEYWQIVPASDEDVKRKLKLLN